MLEEDPAEITVHVVYVEKYVPFCVPGAEGPNAFVVTWLCRGGRLIVAAPFRLGGVVCVHWRMRSGCSFSEIFCDVCWRRSGRGCLRASSSPGMAAPPLPQWTKPVMIHSCPPAAPPPPRRSCRRFLPSFHHNAVSMSTAPPHPHSIGPWVLPNNPTHNTTHERKLRFLNPSFINT